MLLFVAVAVVLLIAIAGLAIDGSYVYKVRTECQATADSAALAAASLLPDLYAARAAAMSYGAKNMDPKIHGTVIDADDVEFGDWNFDTRVFTPTNDPGLINAVRVSTHRSSDNSNPLQLTLGQVFGYTTSDVTLTAVAAFSSQLPWDICLTQDVTSSFTEEISYAKQADQNLLDCLASQSPPDTRMGIVSFTGWGKEIKPMTWVTSGYSTLKTALVGLKICGSSGAPPCSGTDIAAGLSQAIATLDAGKSTAAPEVKRAIVLVSDGQPTQSSSGSHPTSSQSQLKTLAEAQAAAAWAKGYHVFVVYYDGDHDAAAMAWMPKLVKGDGVFLSTPNPADLPGLLSQICKNLIDLQLVD